MQANEQAAAHANCRRSTRLRMPNINGQDVLTVAEAAQRREHLANRMYSSAGRKFLCADWCD